MKDKVLWIIVTVVLVVIFVYSLFFNKPVYEITFDSNGGTAVASQEIKKGDVVTKPEDPVRDGYIFKEWQVNGETYDFTTEIKANSTITALWEEKPTTTTKKTTTKKTTTKKTTTKKTTTTKPTTTTTKATTTTTKKK